MVPADFANFFMASTGAGAALVGLLFVSISIAPERTVSATAPVERQAVAASAFTALLNPFIISMIALIPGLALVGLGWVTTIMSVIGLINTFSLGWLLLRHPGGWGRAARRGLLVLGGLTLYAYEFYFGILIISTSNPAYIFLLAIMLVVSYALGLTRAWELLGARRYRMIDWLNPLQDTEEREQAQPEK